MFRHSLESRHGVTPGGSRLESVAAMTLGRRLRRTPDIEQEHGLTVVRTFHPSPQALFVCDREERAARVRRRSEAFHEVAELLAG